jgi:hypothetical protein
MEKQNLRQVSEQQVEEMKNDIAKAERFTRMATIATGLGITMILIIVMSL